MGILIITGMALLIFLEIYCEATDTDPRDLLEYLDDDDKE